MQVLTTVLTTNTVVDHSSQRFTMDVAASPSDCLGPRWHAMDGVPPKWGSGGRRFKSSRPDHNLSMKIALRRSRIQGDFRFDSNRDSNPLSFHYPWVLIVRGICRQCYA